MPNSYTQLGRHDTHDRVLRLELVRIRFQPFGRQSLAIDKCPVGRFYIFDVNLR